MGVSTNGILAYGYRFGAPESLALYEARETKDNPYGEFRASWYNPEDKDDDGNTADVIEQAILVLYESIPDAPPAKYSWNREGIVKARLGVWFESYCSGDYPMYVLTTKAYTAYRGDADVIPLADLTQGIDEWNGQLAHSLQVLGVTPNQERAEWLLCSYWG